MELFRLLGTIAVENTDAVKALKETSTEGEKTESKLSNTFDKIGGAAKKMGKVVAAGVGAAATAIGTITTMAVKSYADYEQLIGGVETLYGASIASVEEYAEKHGIALDYAELRWEKYQQREQAVLANAREAYKTAGMSVNEYMETVNGFAASLISSLGEYEHNAANMADMIVTDMADNANKMGTSLEAIQNAYSGFSKQNYTMLDNLKLGYGGTKEEMERLLATAAEIEGVEMFDINSFADVAQAIHIIQEEMGITGTTAAEASQTISGSIATMKSAWKNLLVGFADSSQDIDALVSNMYESIITVGKNLIPRIKETIQGMWGVVKTNAPKILADIPNLMMQMLPQSVKDIMSEAHDYLCDTVVFGLEAVWESVKNLSSAFKPLIDAVKSFIAPLKDANEQQKINVEIVYFLEDALYKVANVIDIVAGVLGTVIQTIVKIGVPAIQSMATIFRTLQTVVGEAIDQYIIPLIQDFVAMIQELLAENQDKINKICELFTILSERISWVVQNVIYPIFVLLIGIVRSSMDNIKNYIQSAFNIIGGIIDFFIALFTLNWQGMWDSVLSIISSCIELIVSRFALWKDFIVDIMNSIWSIMVEIWENIKISISTKISSIVSTVGEKFEEVKNSISNKINAAKDVVHDAIEAIKGFFDFEFKWPHIPLPHFSISPYGWKIGDLLDGVVPSLGIEWYAKGGVLEEPTAFGINGNKLMVGGEAGPEAVAPIDVLQKYIEEAVTAQNTGLVDILQKILAAILSNNEEMKDKFIEALEEMRFDINNREFARLVKAVN